MRRWFVIHLFGLSLALTLTGCDVVAQLWPWIIEQNPPDTDTPDTPPAAPSIEHARTFMALEDGRVLSATSQGFRIIDVRDARHPRVEGLVDLVCNSLSFYRVGEHVILLAEFVEGYAGARADVPFHKQADSLLVNVDISDRAHPTIVEEIELDDLPRSSLMRKAPDSSALFVFPMVYEEVYHSRIERYDLREGRLRKTADTLLDSTAEAIDATPEKLLVATAPAPNRSTVTVLDIAAGQLTTSFTATLAGHASRFSTRLALSGDRLRVSYSANDTGFIAIDTFDLSLQPTAAAVGHCVTTTQPGYWEYDALAFDASTDDLFSSKTEPNGELVQLMLDADGGCLDQVAYGPDSRSSQLHASGVDRMLGYGPIGLSMYETGPAATEQPVARAALPGPFTGGNASGPIQLLDLPRPLAAPNGTLEPQLAVIPNNSWPIASGFQLFTLSDRTITPRAALDLRARPDSVALLAPALVAASATELRTFDARDLNAPVGLGQLELAEQYYELFRFGDYIARIRVDPYVGPPEERARLVHDDLQVLRRSDVASGAPPVASLPVEPLGKWLQVGQVLVNAQLRGGPADSFGEPASEITLQVYDLSDTTQPRKAGRLETTDVRARWTGGHFPEGDITYQQVGQTLVVQQTKRLPDGMVRECRRSIDYNVCEHEATPTCQRETYTGERTCYTIDSGPEMCFFNVWHCLLDACESLSTLPPGIPLGPQFCYEYPEQRGTQAYAFDVVDFRDPDRPTLVRPQIALPEATISRDYFIAGDNIYTTEQVDAGLAVRVIDLSDPSAPTISPPQPISDSIVAVDEDVVYTAPRGFEPAPLRLSRTRCCSEDSQPLAARDWPGRLFLSMVPDGAGKLYLVHGQLGGTVDAADPQSSWDRLEILDEQTLETFATLDIDRSALARVPPVDGKLLVEAYSVLFLIDVRDARHPTVQAALPESRGNHLIDRDGVVVSDARGLRNYPLDLQNMMP